MRYNSASVALSLVFLCTAHAEQAGNNVQFEVASVKKADQSARRGCTGGPGTSNPGTWSCTRITLAELVFTAYDLELYQFQPPD